MIQSGARHHGFSPDSSGMPRIETKSPPGPGWSLSAVVNDPVCLGGNNASPLNHWPQAISGE
jgi:hypothetical protein